MWTSVLKTAASCALLAACVFTAPVQAHSFKSQDIKVIHPHARPSVPGVQTGSVWFGITNSGKHADKLVGVRVDPKVAEQAEIHDMAVNDGVMAMRKIDGFPIPAGKTMYLGKDNGLHVMLQGLKKPLKEDDDFHITLEFERAGAMKVEVWVEKDDPKSSGHVH